VNILGLLIVSTIAEAVWETLKMTWQAGKASIDRIGALVVGIVVALATGMDILALVEIPVRIPGVGIVLTGILLSRGSNFVHDVLASIDNMHINSKPQIKPPDK
jgi:ABC-type transport system involved in cytochrome c biogenesis permease component